LTSLLEHYKAMKEASLPNTNPLSTLSETACDLFQLLALELWSPSWSIRWL